MNARPLDQLCNTHAEFVHGFAEDCKTYVPRMKATVNQNRHMAQPNNKSRMSGRGDVCAWEKDQYSDGVYVANGALLF